MTRHQRFTDQQLWKLNQQLSHRHRTWCDEMKATDIDATDDLMLRGVFTEYVFKRPVALIDYKYRHWSWTASIDVVKTLGQMAGLPSFVVAYTPASDEWTFQVWPVNEHAEAWVPVEYRGYEVTETRFVRWLHKLRGVTCCHDWTPAKGVTSAR